VRAERPLAKRGGGKGGGAGDLRCVAGGFCLAARVTPAGGAGELPCGAGKGGIGLRRGRSAWRRGDNGRRRGRFALRRRQGWQRPATRAVRLASREICLAARARVATAGDAGVSPGGAVDHSWWRGRFALRHGQFLPCGAVDNCRWRGRCVLRRGQGRQRPATRAARLAATYGRGKGVYSGTSIVDPAAMAVDGGNATGEAHVAHAVAGDGPDVDRSTDPEMVVNLSLAARSTRTLARPRWSMGSWSLLTRVCTTFASATALARTLGVSTSQFPVSHYSDVGSGRPVWPTVWDLHPSHLLVKILGTRNMRVWR